MKSLIHRYNRLEGNILWNDIIHISKIDSWYFFLNIEYSLSIIYCNKYKFNWLSCFACKNNFETNNICQNFALFNQIILRRDGWMRKWDVYSFSLNNLSKWLWELCFLLNNNNKNGYLNNMQMIYCNVQLQINV